MKNIIEDLIRLLMQKFGFDIYRSQNYPKNNIETYNTVKPFTMTSTQRVHALIDAVNYIEKNNIDGAMVECGVWKGGSTMAMALTLKNLCAEDRDLYLYDTFSGMNTPSDHDISVHGLNAHEYFSKTKTSEDSSDWCLASLDEVKKNVYSTGYSKEKFHFIRGKVEDTIPKNLPNKIALLRLDTDWYESTKHELTHLFPLLSPNGILIIDDYGYWEGAKKAVDEYISEKNICIFLNRIDNTGRIAIKT